MTLPNGDVLRMVCLSVIRFLTLWFVVGDRQLPQRERQASLDGDKDHISDSSAGWFSAFGWALPMFGQFLSV